MANSSVQASDENSAVGAFKFIIDKIKQDIQGMLPCRVTSVDRNRNRVVVKPLVTMLTSDGIALPRAEIQNVPIFNLSAGNFIINYPVKVGNLGWIKANDRDISLFLKNLSEATPNTLRKHKFNDGVFFPDSMFKDVNIASEDADKLVIQSNDGAVKITLSDDTITFKATEYNFEGGRIYHDGIAIDKFHGHPQGADSAGNTQVTTNAPVDIE